MLASSETSNVFLECMRHYADEEPNAIAVSDEYGELSYRALWQSAEALSSVIAQRRTLCHDMSTQLYVGNAGFSGTAFTTIFLATLLVGETSVSLPNSLTQQEAADFMGQVPLNLIIASRGSSWSDFLPRTDHCQLEFDFLAFDIFELPDQNPLGGDHRQFDWLQFTSGSTGVSKGVLLEGAQISANIELNHDWLNRWCGTAVFCSMPQFHAMGGAVVQEYLSVGASVHMANAFVPGADVRIMREKRVSVLVASPSYVKMMLVLKAFTPTNLPDLKCIEMGSAVVDHELLKALRAMNPGLILSIRYGQSEAVGALCRALLGPESSVPATGYIGAPIDGVESKSSSIEGTDEVELVFRGPAVARYGVQNKERFNLVSGDGWLYTGDVAKELVVMGSSKCEYQVVGRHSTFIKHLGYRVNPFEVEQCLKLHEGVKDAVVVGRADPMAGEVVVAVVQRDEGCSQEVTVESLQLYCSEHLSSYKCPKFIQWVDSIPRTLSGKPDRRAVSCLVE